MYDGYLLNPANGKTVSSKVAEPTATIYLADGTLDVRSTGHHPPQRPRARAS